MPIGPPSVRDVFYRYAHQRPPSTITFLNHFLRAYRWCQSILTVGADLESMRALAEYCPDAVIHTFDSVPADRRLHQITMWNPAEFNRRFSVIIVVDKSDPIPLLQTVKDYGLIVVEGNMELPIEFKVESTSLRYMIKV